MTGECATLFSPASVLVVDASDDPGEIGGRVLMHLRMSGYAGRILPVNPGLAAVQGIGCLPGIAAAPDGVDCAVITLAAEAAVVALEACAAKGVRSAILLSGGFAETGAAGAVLQARVRAVIDASGMLLVGPNSLGLFHTASRFFATFTTSLTDGLPAEGGVAIVSQSGAVGSHLLVQARRTGVGLGTWVTTGNEVGLGVGALLCHLADDPATRVICLFMEAVHDADLLVRGLEAAASAGKAVIVLKIGRSTVAQEAAAGHTGAIAIEDAVVDGVLTQHGAIRVTSLDEMMDLARAALAGRWPTSRRLGIFTVSGGIGGLIADAAQAAGLEVEPLPASAQTAIRARVPLAGTRNPVDLTSLVAYAPTALGAEIIAEAMVAGEHAGAICYFTNTPAMRPAASPLRDGLLALPDRLADRVLLLCAFGPDEVMETYRTAGWITVGDPSRATLIFDRLCELGARPRRTSAEERVLAPRLDPPDGPMTEQAVKAWLRSFGVVGPPERVARAADEAAAIADGFGYPIALKIVSPDIQHKTEVGGVVLGLADRAAVLTAHAAIVASVARLAPNARIAGVTVSPMASHGRDMIVAARIDPAFGPIVLAGLGGVEVEITKDVAIRRAPIDLAEARRMIDSLRGAAPARRLSR